MASKTNSKDASISARCDPADRDRYRSLARRFGYSNFSEFLIEVLEGLDNEFGDHESQLLHMSGERVVGSGPMPAGGGPTSAFPVIAPARFWRHVQRHTKEG